MKTSLQQNFVMRTSLQQICNENFPTTKFVMRTSPQQICNENFTTMNL